MFLVGFKNYKFESMFFAIPHLNLFFEDIQNLTQRWKILIINFIVF